MFFSNNWPQILTKLGGLLALAAAACTSPRMGNDGNETQGLRYTGPYTAQLTPTSEETRALGLSVESGFNGTYFHLVIVGKEPWSSNGKKTGGRSADIILSLIFNFTTQDSSDPGITVISYQRDLTQESYPQSCPLLKRTKITDIYRSQPRETFLNCIKAILDHRLSSNPELRAQAPSLPTSQQMAAKGARVDGLLEVDSVTLAKVLEQSMGKIVNLDTVIQGVQALANAPLMAVLAPLRSHLLEKGPQNAASQSKTLAKCAIHKMRFRGKFSDGTTGGSDIPRSEFFACPGLGQALHDRRDKQGIYAWGWERSMYAALAVQEALGYIAALRKHARPLYEKIAGEAFEGLSRSLSFAAFDKILGNRIQLAAYRNGPNPEASARSVVPLVLLDNYASLGQSAGGISPTLAVVFRNGTLSLPGGSYAACLSHPRVVSKEICNTAAPDLQLGLGSDGAGPLPWVFPPPAACASCLTLNTSDSTQSARSQNGTVAFVPAIDRSKAVRTQKGSTCFVKATAQDEAGSGAPAALMHLSYELKDLEIRGIPFNATAFNWKTHDAVLLIREEKTKLNHQAAVSPQKNNAFKKLEWSTAAGKNQVELTFVRWNGKRPEITITHRMPDPRGTGGQLVFSGGLLCPDNPLIP